MDEKLCCRCGQTKPIEKFYKLKRRGGEIVSYCKLCDRKRTRAMRDGWRVEILKKYSDGQPKCAECGETRIPVLDVDHVNGGGIEARKGFKTTAQYYLWLRKQTKQNTLRILCRNCNWMAWIERKNRYVSERNKDL